MVQAPSSRPAPPPGASIGLIAGWGEFPLSVARTLRQSGHAVHCVAINGHADASLDELCQHTLWAGVGRFGRHVRFFRRAGVRHVTMAGKLFKSEILYDGSIFWRHHPDLTCLRTFGSLLWGRQRDARDDRLLGAVIDTYHRYEMQVCAATDLAPQLLISAGVLTRRRPDVAQQRDVDIGWQVAKTMGGMDIGQAITIKDGTVIAVEAIEGTDACIARTGELCGRGGWALVKVSKPNQDMRFDVPTIGAQTVRGVHAAGGRVIAVEAEKTILLDRDETLRLADQLGVAVIAR